MRGTRTAWIGLVVAWLLIGACAPAPAAPAAPARPAATVAAPAAAPTPPAAPEAAPAAPAAAGADSPAAGAARTLDQELAIPDALLQAARREGKVSMIHAIDADQMQKIFEVFSRRYPGLELEYQDAGEEVRTVRTLAEFKSGRNRLDIVGSLGGFIVEYEAADALVPLNDLPAYASYAPPYVADDHKWFGESQVNWGIAYNTNRLQPADLPKTWEDLTNPRWKDRIALADRPQLWALQLWKAWGPERTTSLLDAILANGQRRRESVDALSNLLGAGEFDQLIPAEPSTIQVVREKGAPVAWFSPEPISVAVSQVALLQRSPHPNAAKLFANWLMSREGQEAFHQATKAVPSHPALRTQPQYQGAFADAVIGRTISLRQPEDDARLLPSVRETWRRFWLR
jgi:iron(III) transport system substrate-binding protein